MSKPRVKVKDTVKAGEIVEVKTLLNHPMETGLRKDKDGNPVPKDMIESFSATFAGREVFRVALNTGVSANPYLAFYFKADSSGDLVMTWTDTAGKAFTDTRPITVG